MNIHKDIDSNYSVYALLGFQHLTLKNEYVQYKLKKTKMPKDDKYRYTIKLHGPPAEFISVPIGTTEILAINDLDCLSKILKIFKKFQLYLYAIELSEKQNA